MNSRMHEYERFLNRTSLVIFDTINQNMNRTYFKSRLTSCKRTNYDVIKVFSCSCANEAAVKSNQQPNGFGLSLGETDFLG